MKADSAVIACYLYRAIDDNEVWASIPEDELTSFGDILESLEFIEYVSRVAEAIKQFIDLEIWMRAYKYNKRIAYSHMLKEVVYPLGKIIGKNAFRQIEITTLLNILENYFNAWHARN